MKIISESKSGSKTNHKMEMTQEERQAIVDAGFNVYSCGTVETINKSDKANFDLFVFNYNKEQEQPAINEPKPSSKNSRKLCLLSVAERDGLDHGKSWHCSSQKIDEESLPPHWEGQQICYVYGV